MFIYFNYNNLIYWLIPVCLLLTSCKQNEESHSDRNAIVTAYANEFLDDKNDYLYYKSKEDITRFTDFLNPPLTVKRVQEVTKPVEDIRIESLIDSDDIKAWNRTLRNYQSNVWKKDKLPEVSIIKEKEIPEFFYKGGIPMKEDTVITVHFISTPIIHEDVALLYYTVQRSPMNGSSGYVIYGKINNMWKIIARDIVVWVS